MADEIRVDQYFLSDLQNRYVNVANSLRELKNVPENLSDAPPVQSALADFQDRWDWTRGKLAESADAYADAVGAVRDSFVEADAALADTLESGC